MPRAAAKRSLHGPGIKAKRFRDGKLAVDALDPIKPVVGFGLWFRKLHSQLLAWRSLLQAMPVPGTRHMTSSELLI